MTWLVGSERRPVEPPAGKYVLDFGLAEVCERELARIRAEQDAGVAQVDEIEAAL